MLAEQRLAPLVRIIDGFGGLRPPHGTCPIVGKNVVTFHWHCRRDG